MIEGIARMGLLLFVNGVGLLLVGLLRDWDDGFSETPGSLKITLIACGMVFTLWGVWLVYCAYGPQS